MSEIKTRGRKPRTGDDFPVRVLVSIPLGQYKILDARACERNTSAQTLIREIVTRALNEERATESEAA